MAPGAQEASKSHSRRLSREDLGTWTPATWKDTAQTLRNCCLAFGAELATGRTAKALTSESWSCWMVRASSSPALPAMGASTSAERYWARSWERN